MKLTIIYNNEANPNLKSGWGFSCLIEENGKKVLFDTGCEGPGLLYNIKELGYENNENQSFANQRFSSFNFSQR